MSSPGYDHLGLLQDTRQEVDDLLEACERYADKDDRVTIRRYDDLVYPDLTVHAFYVKYLLPIYFDVQCMERPGPAAERRRLRPGRPRCGASGRAAARRHRDVDLQGAPGGLNGEVRRTGVRGDPTALDGRAPAGRVVL